jgi:cytochrome P450
LKADVREHIVRDVALTIPAHIPPERVFDFDFFNLPGAEEDIHLAWKRVQDAAPDLFWTPRNGGHWVATRAEDIDVMQLDHARFSHAEFSLPRHDSPFPPLPLNLDPPAHTPFRALITPAFAPRAVQNLSIKAREVAIELIEEIAPRGECEFVGDFAKVLPIVVFLGIVDLPEGDRLTLLPWADIAVRSNDPVAKLQANRSMAEYLSEWIEKRTRSPGNDLVSKIAHAQLDGRPLTPPEVFGLCLLILVGGLDTVAGMLAFSARCLAQQPHLRRELIDNSDIMPVAIEELMRRHGLPNTFRLITSDFEYKGVPFKKGEMVQLPKVLYNLDERRIPDPLTVDFHRPTPIPNATFGNGPHKCPGANLARTEIRIFLEEWLKRIPNFRIKPGSRNPTAGGMVNGILQLHLEWDVAAR